ncbi:MAG: hypothetical protein AAB525_03555 [Patescibacteria group bacterium]
MKNIWQNLIAGYHHFENERLEVIDASHQLKISAKKLIHKILHQRIKQDLEELKKIKEMMNQLLGLIKRNPWLYQVGAINEGLEEYAELVFLEVYLKDDQEILKHLPAGIGHDALIGGMADASGELVRLVRAKMNIEEAKKAHQYISNLYEHFLDLEVSRNNKLRSKIGEVRRNLLQLEEIIFSLNLKKGI